MFVIASVDFSQGNYGTYYRLLSVGSTEANDYGSALYTSILHNASSTEIGGYRNYDANYNEWHLICRNPNAIPLIEINFNKIDWKSLCYNKNAVRILEHHIDKIYWPALEHNINATHLIEYLIKLKRYLF